MHLVDSNEKKQPQAQERNISSLPLPLQSLPTGEKLQRQYHSTIESVDVRGTEMRMRKFPAADAKAVALYLHGIEGHAEWFANTAAVLNDAGICVYAPDRRGAGLNTLERGHVENSQVLVDDLEFFLNLVAGRHPELPLFLIGNCWGAKVAALVAAESHKWSTAISKPQLEGLVLICPAIKTKPDLRFSEKLSIAIALLFGKEALKEQIPIPLTTEMFTDNHIFLDYIERDPLRMTSASKAFYFASFILSLKSSRVASSIKIPTLILQSDNDAIVDVPGIETWFAKINQEEKKYKKYAGAAHSMDFDRRQFIDYARDLSQWIVKISAQSRKRGIAQ